MPRHLAALACEPFVCRKVGNNPALAPVSESEDPTETPGCASVGDGFHLVENLLLKVFGCYQTDMGNPAHDAAGARSMVSDRQRVERPQRSRRIQKMQSHEIPWPPQIRRVGLEETKDGDVKRSSSLNFLFHQHPTNLRS